ncbi:MAG: FG-GAP-like repeat-containing protein [Candidatus Sabulitectum sp.]|nr:FG-GAP-like repeat-containing protein [Candidatus Sabulitectum sp.]
MKRLALFAVLPALLSQTVRAEFIFEQAYEQILTAGSTVSLDGGDFNNDGFPDFVVTCCINYSYLFIFQGNGDCTFDLTTSVVTYSMGSITVNDFNNDGNLDLLIGEGWMEDFDPHESDVIHRFEGHGDGSFTELNTLIVENIWITSGDLNNDGNCDLVTSDVDDDKSPNDTVLVRLGNGDFTFQEATSYYIPNRILHTVQILGDMDLDGNNDIGLINECYSTITFLYGNGDGTFQPAKTVADHYANMAFSFLGVGDFNEDGMTDMIATGGDPMTVISEVLIWNATEFFYEPAHSFLPAGNWIEIEDFNMDGHLDAALSTCVRGYVFPGYGNGHFPSWWPTDSLLLETPDLTFGVLSEDFDLDGDQDLIFVGGVSTCCYRNNTLTQGCTGETACGISDLTFSVSPNPFSSSAAIEVSGNHSVNTSIQIFNVCGRLITELEPVSGDGVYVWDGKSSSGVEVPSGIYAVKCCSGNAVSSSMVLKLE